MRIRAVLLALLLIVVGCGGPGEPAFDGTLEFERAGGFVRGGYNRLVLSGDGTGEVTFGILDPTEVTVADGQLDEIAAALHDVDLDRLASQPYEAPDVTDVDTYRLVYDGTTVEVAHGGVPAELQVLIDHLVDLIAANEPAT